MRHWCVVLLARASGGSSGKGGNGCGLGSFACPDNRAESLEAGALAEQRNLGVLVIASSVGGGMGAQAVHPARDRTVQALLGPYHLPAGLLAYWLSDHRFMGFGGSSRISACATRRPRGRAASLLLLQSVGRSGFGGALSCTQAPGQGLALVAAGASSRCNATLDHAPVPVHLCLPCVEG